MGKVKKIKPLYTKVLLSAYRYSLEEMQEEGDLIDATKVDQPLKEYQTVIEVGDSVRNVKIGDKVKFDPRNYIKRKFGPNQAAGDMDGNNPIMYYDFPTVEINDEIFLLLDERDIEYIVIEQE